jgi:hypothetical protein
MTADANARPQGSPVLDRLQAHGCAKSMIRRQPADTLRHWETVHQQVLTGGHGTWGMGGELVAMGTRRRAGTEAAMIGSSEKQREQREQSSALGCLAKLLWRRHLEQEEIQASGRYLAA